MTIEPIPSGYTDPVAYSRRVGGTSPPETGAIARAVGKPTPYIDESGLVLAKALGKSLEAGRKLVQQTYGSTGEQANQSSRGSTLDITA
ncbi:hypothetical protein A6A04_13140 [Paramagnetospirillum marisnigri]|uniref:Uncharacterized protein n=2 Tax=Paramagnetospirillum marisnigri TaxID=1285242 RepID=A0A178MWR7_9PROT|nr:hypothetical protein A6A04_13140 [Paramagnetospirillum marisnigri]